MRGMRDNNISRCISFLETNIPHGEKRTKLGIPGRKSIKREKAFYVLKILVVGNLALWYNST